jgi:large subunit ribosomal protein L7Ae
MRSSISLQEANMTKAPKRKVAPAPFASANKAPKKAKNPLIEKRTKNFGIGISLSFTLN